MGQRKKALASQGPQSTIFLLPLCRCTFVLLWVSSHSEAFLFLGPCSADLRPLGRYQLLTHISSVVFINVLVIDDVIGLLIQFLPEDS